MADIVDRLRGQALGDLRGAAWGQLMAEAADEIERLGAALRTLKGAGDRLYAVTDVVRREYEDASKTAGAILPKAKAEVRP